MKLLECKQIIYHGKERDLEIPYTKFVSRNLNINIFKVATYQKMCCDTFLFRLRKLENHRR